jgi:hypothetical protein
LHANQACDDTIADVCEIGLECFGSPRRCRPLN